MIPAGEGINAWAEVEAEVARLKADNARLRAACGAMVAFWDDRKPMGSLMDRVDALRAALALGEVRP